MHADLHSAHMLNQNQTDLGRPGDSVKVRKALDGPSELDKTFAGSYPVPEFDRERNLVRKFISEDDLETFEGWLRYQAVGMATLTPSEIKMWRGYFNDRKERSLSSGKVGLMKLKPIPGEYRYAVAVREGSDLWLVLWVRKSRKGEIFAMIPRNDRDWDAHTSYHLNGTMHSKSFGKTFHPQRRQPLTGTFRGTEQFPGIGGFEPKSVGAICDPTAFIGIVEVAAGVLGPVDGTVVVELVEPNCEPTPFSSAPLVRQEVFQESIPWIVVRVFS